MPKNKQDCTQENLFLTRQRWAFSFLVITLQQIKYYKHKLFIFHPIFISVYKKIKKKIQGSEYT